MTVASTDEFEKKGRLNRTTIFLFVAGRCQISLFVM